MTRRNVSRKHPEVELFPFLSILACTIGTLILFIVVLTTQSLKERGVTIVAKTDGENGVNKDKSPRYIECRADGVVLYPGKKFVPLAQLKESNSPIQELISQLQANRDREYLIVAVRANGIDTFYFVRSLVEKAKIDIGYEPMDAGWQLKFDE